MSIWIFDRVLRGLLAGLVALFVLGACGGGAGLPQAAPQKLRVSGNEVVIAGPRGFCIDPTATRDGAESAFVLLGSCAAISKLRFRPKPGIPAILAVTVSGGPASAPVAQSMGRLGAFFKTKAGRAALSRDGKAKTVDVIESFGKGGIFYIHVLDHSNDTLPGAGDEYWRALFDVKGRLVSASVFSLEDRPISAKAGFETLGAFTSRIIAENAGKPARKKPAVPFFKRLFQ